jgi:hypothetical protein
VAQEALQKTPGRSAPLLRKLIKSAVLRQVPVLASSLIAGNALDRARSVKTPV